MLTDLDSCLFPDDCEVVSLPLHNLNLYLIQKNGSSSIRKDAKRHDWSVHRGESIKDLDHVDVFLRDPTQRYVSGVNTFVQHLMRDHPHLDRMTCLHMALHYPFLNRHYLPQWHWLLNLARFLDKDCEIRFHDLSGLGQITDLHSHAGIEPMPAEEKKLAEAHANNLKLWFLMDEILMGYIGQSLSWSQLLGIYKNHPAKPLEIITSRFTSVYDVLR